MDLVEFRKRYEHKEVIEKPSLVSSKPLVSVCVQTYQHANFIEECLDGILMQKTDFVFEILLGEDASTDGTREICISYAERYPDKIRLFLHHRENNIAIGGSPTGRFIFMTNLLTARGEYIALCEGDDYWTDPYKLQKQVDFLETNQEYSACFTDAKVIYQNSNQTRDYVKNKKKKIYSIDSIIKKGGGFFPTATLVFRNIINEFPKFIYQYKAGDRVLSLLLGMQGDFYFMKINTAVYRRHSGGAFSGLINNKKKRLALKESNINLLHDFNEFSDRKYDQTIKQVISRYYLLLLVNSDRAIRNDIQQKEFLEMNFKDKIAYFKNVLLKKDF